MEQQNFFDIEYDFENRSNFDKGLLATYYAFTSLSTVGFGDYNPKSNVERVLCAFILLFGVSIFSYIMGIFIEILNQIKELQSNLDDGDFLTCFLHLMQNFNGGKPINPSLSNKIYEFFDYKWTNDRLQAIDDEEEIKILMQFPEFV